jgi:signal transduction histidine kinase
MEFACQATGASKNVVGKILDELEYTTNQMSESIESMRNYINPQKVKERFNIQKTIEEVMLFYMPLLDREKIEYEIKNAIPFFISGYKNEVMQILLILLNNAKDALIIDSCAFAKITVQTSLDEDFFQLKVIDNGAGISEDNLEILFKPYFTTKHLSGGTGIGLYVAKQIVEDEMGGKLVLKNLKNPTIFVVKFPKKSQI